MVLVCLVFLIQPVYYSGERSQSISLDNPGYPLSIVNVQRMSPNFCNLRGYFSPPTRLPPNVGSKMLARAILSLYYLYNTTYIINLNSKIYRPLPGFEPGSPGPKAATLPSCNTPLTLLQYFPHLTIEPCMLVSGEGEFKLFL